MRGLKKRVPGPAYSTYKGRVHGVPVRPGPAFPDRNAIIDGACGGHAAVDEPDMLRGGGREGRP